MKRAFILFVSIFICSNIYSQVEDDFETYNKNVKKGWENYSKKVESDWKTYNDSCNKAYTKYLEQTWKDFKLNKDERNFKPMPKPPVYDTTIPKPIPPTPLPVKSLPDKPEPNPPTPIPPIEPNPSPAPQNTITTMFFGSEINLNKMSFKQKHLTDVSNKSIANYWTFLSSLKYNEWLEEIVRIKIELNLNDWAMYQLLEKVFKAYFSNGNENETVIFSIFTLNQLGYQAKIGRSNNSLVPLITSQNKLINTSTFTNGKNTYYVINSKHKNLSSVQSCGIDYDNAKNVLNFTFNTIPFFSDNVITKNLKFGKNIYLLKYNKNLIDFYSTYPCMDFSLYLNASMDKISLESIEKELASGIKGKTQEEQINILLHFVQNAFDYKTDDAQYGCEKWNLAEETIASAYSDCDDRAIFFAQLVKRLTRMNVVLIYYPGYHLATAVKFDNARTNGDYIMVDNVKYLICDPTYTNANFGVSMPQLRNIPVEIIK
ncbi:MAG: hypothetical protein PHI14_00445 [Bacteroidales bacterium]|nr:hypothetical protein [Bacteroidales bacterium]